MKIMADMSKVPGIVVPSWFGNGILVVKALQNWKKFS